MNTRFDWQEYRTLRWSYQATIMDAVLIGISWCFARGRFIIMQRINWKPCASGLWASGYQASL